MEFSVIGILIILVVIIFFIRGWITGFVKAVFDLISVFAISILTWLLYPSISRLLISTSVYNGIHSWIGITLKDNKIISTALPDFLNELPDFLKDSILASAKQLFDSVLVSTTDALTVLSINAISIIAIFTVLILITVFMKKFGKFINKIVIIGHINKILGGILGLVQGVFICYLIIMIISYFPASELYDYAAKDIEKSVVCKVMYNENIKFFGFKPTYPVIRGD